MKKSLLLVLAIFLFATSCKNEVVIDRDAETKAIQTVVESMLKSIADADVKTLTTFLTEDFLAFDMARILRTEDLSNAVSEMVQMGFSDLRYTIDPLQSDIYENDALFCYKNTLTGKLGDQDLKMDFLESCFMIKSDNGWKIKFLHSTQVPPPAEAE